MPVAATNALFLLHATLIFQALVDDAEACRRKMSNATALIEGLSGERIRWTETSKGFADQISRLVGDVLLATGFLSYAGPFNQEFRNLMIKNWKRELVSNEIPFSDVSFYLYQHNLIPCQKQVAHILKNM